MADKITQGIVKKLYGDDSPTPSPMTPEALIRRLIEEYSGHVWNCPKAIRVQHGRLEPHPTDPDDIVTKAYFRISDKPCACGYDELVAAIFASAQPSPAPQETGYLALCQRCGIWADAEKPHTCSDLLSRTER